MKKILAATLLFIIQGSIAQVTKNLGDFNELKVFDRITVELVPSSENKIEINGNRSNEVEIVNKNGELKIRMSLKKLLKGEDINAKLYFRELRSIDASEGATIEGPEKMLTQTSMDITAKEGAQVKLNLETKKATIKAVTGGIIKITGKSDNMDAKLGMGGVLYAKDFATYQTDITVTAGGNAEVNASELVDADVKAGGNVVIFGSPKQIDKSTSLGGTIEERRE